MKTLKTLAIASMALMACACNTDEPELTVPRQSTTTTVAHTAQAPKELTVAQSPLRLTPDMVGPETYVPIDLTLSPMLQQAESNTSATDVLEWIAESAVKAVAGKSAGYIFDLLVKSDESKQLDDLTAQTEAINNKLDELINQVKMDHYEDYINSRLDIVSAMYTHDDTYEKELSRCDSTDIDRITQLAQEWGNSPLCQGIAAEQAQNFITKITKTLIDQATYYDAYDAYVFNAVPWEHMGYDFRQALRDGDMATMATSAKLAILYYTTHPTLSEIGKQEKLQAISDAVASFKAYSEAHTVVHHSDAVCQILGCHVVMPAAIYYCNYYNQTWVPTGKSTVYSDHFASDVIYGHEGMSQSEFRSKLLTMDEASKLNNYYQQKDPNTSLWDHMKQDAGFVNYMPATWDDAWLLVNGNAYSDKNRYQYTLMAPVLHLGGSQKLTNTDIATAEFGTTVSFTPHLYFEGWASNSFHGQTIYNMLISQRF